LLNHSFPELYGRGFTHQNDGNVSRYLFRFIYLVKIDVEQLSAELVSLNLSYESVPGLLLGFDVDVDETGGAPLDDNTLELGGVTLQSQRFNVVSEDMGRGDALPPQEARLLAQDVPLGCL
jgi:hypothetical protein